MNCVPQGAIPRSLNIMQNYESNKCIAIMSKDGKQKLCSNQTVECCAYCPSCEIGIRERISARIKQKKITRQNRSVSNLA